ncbi:unnamed protein product [Lampetra planeri]
MRVRAAAAEGDDTWTPWSWSQRGRCEATSGGEGDGLCRKRVHRLQHRARVDSRRWQSVRSEDDATMKKGLAFKIQWKSVKTKDLIFDENC